jgi:hypothetical protein
VLRLALRCPGLTIVARPAGRPGEKAALFSNKYGQSTGVLIFDQVFVPWERVFLAGNGSTPASSPGITPPITATAASPPGPDLATC